MTGVFMPRTMSEALDGPAGAGSGLEPYQQDPTPPRGLGTTSTNRRPSSTGSSSTGSSSSRSRVGATLRRVPWQQQQPQQTRPPGRSSSYPLSAPGGTLLAQQPPPPPPPPAARAAPAATEVRRSSSGNSRTEGGASRTPSAAALQADSGRAAAATASSATATSLPVVQPHVSAARHGAHSFTLPTASQEQHLLCSSSWDAECGDSPSAAGMSCATAWLLSPSAQPSSGAGQVQGPSPQHHYPASCHSAPLLLAQPALGQQAAGGVPGSWAVSTQQQGLDSSHSSGSNAIYGFGVQAAQTPPAAVPIPARARGMPCACSSSMAAPAGGSWPGPDLLGLSPSLHEVTTLQDSLGGLRADSFPGLARPGAVGWSASSPLPAVREQPHGSAALSAMQHSTAHSLCGSLPGASCCDLDATLALMSQQLAAATATGNGSSATPACMLGTSLDAAALSGPGVLPAYGEVSGPALNLQLQLANEVLGFTDPSSGFVGSASAPISAPAQIATPGGLHNSALLAAPTATAAAGQVGVSGTSLPGSSAVAVAQLKLQQLMAVEKIQQQLQDEVLRLLPLI